MSRSIVSLTALLVGLALLVACRPVADGPSLPVATATQPPPPTPVPHTPVAPLPRVTTQSEPITVLLLATDQRQEYYEANNTDTMMLFHLNPTARRIAILSIPRDLYVKIPTHGQGRINTAYALGERDGTGGLVRARQTVSGALGIPVGHAILINFDVFVTAVDAIGGVDVDVPYTISDPAYPDSGTGFSPFHVAAGEQHLDGETTLKYARTRASPGGDFDRATRQRQVVLALRDRVLSLDLLPSLITQSPDLWASLKDVLRTDLTLGEILDLIIIASRIPSDQIVTAGIDQTCTQFHTTLSGAQVLLPDQIAIEALVTGLFASPPVKAAAQ